MTALLPRKSNGITFEGWMKLVDAKFVRTFGLTSSDFPDWNWMDAFEDDFTPLEAVQSYAEDNDDELRQ